jgi:indole-3-glycerol phosphate synthase
MSILDKILQDKRDEVEARKLSRPQNLLEEVVQAAPPTRDFAGALEADGTDRGFRIIAEVKRASPSKGLIREDFDPVAIAAAYERGGASALSVLTDEKYFQGKLEYLTAIRREVALPILRKDFIVDEYQVWEARAAGADAILLILAALPDEVLAALAAQTTSLGMEVLWEVHQESELERLLALGPRIVGINNRDLRTFDVTLETTRKLLPKVPAGAVSVSESGFFKREELEMLRDWGVGAFLIGESLMRAPDPGEALRQLIDG